MADGQTGGQFVERSIRMFLDVGRQFLGIELAPFAPARFGGEGAGFGGGQIAVNRAPSHVKAAHGLGLGAAGL